MFKAYKAEHQTDASDAETAEAQAIMDQIGQVPTFGRLFTFMGWRKVSIDPPCRG